MSDEIQTLKWPIIRNPFFEKYRERLGEELFQEFAESTKELAKSNMWFDRIYYLNDEECEKFLANRKQKTIQEEMEI